MWISHHARCNHKCQVWISSRVRFVGSHFYQALFSLHLTHGEEWRATTFDGDSRGNSVSNTVLFRLCASISTYIIDHTAPAVPNRFSPLIVSKAALQKPMELKCDEMRMIEWGGIEEPVSVDDPSTEKPPQPHDTLHCLLSTVSDPAWRVKCIRFRYYPLLLLRLENLFINWWGRWNWKRKNSILTGKVQAKWKRSTVETVSNSTCNEWHQIFYDIHFNCQIKN